MPAAKSSPSASTQSKKTDSATEQFIESATEINVIIDKVNKLNDEMMSTFDTLHDSITRNFGMFQSRFTELETQLQTAQAENRDHKDAADTFNRVSMLKKQDIEIRQNQIKIAELESRIKFLEKENSRLSSQSNNLSTQSVSKAGRDRIEDEPESYCNARLGKKKFKVSNQAAGFMDDYPEDVFVTDTGCVIGQACNEPIPSGETFCAKHSNGKFEDIRKAPMDTVPVTQKESELVKKAPEPVKKTPEVEPEDEVEEEPEDEVEVKEPVKKAPEPVDEEEPEDEVEKEPEDEVEVTEPVKKAPELVKKVAEPVKKAPEPVNEEEPEDEVEEEPEDEVVEPVKKAHEPVKKVVEPVKKAPEPVKKVAEPVKKVAEPVKKAPEPVVKKVTEPVKKAPEPVVKKVAEPVVKKVLPNIDSTAKPPVTIPDLDKDNIDIHTLADGTSYYINMDTGDLFEMTENDDIGVFVGKLKK